MPATCPHSGALKNRITRIERTLGAIEIVDGHHRSQGRGKRTPGRPRGRSGDRRIGVVRAHLMGNRCYRDRTPVERATRVSTRRPRKNRFRVEDSKFTINLNANHSLLRSAWECRLRRSASSSSSIPNDPSFVTETL